MLWSTYCDSLASTESKGQFRTACAKFRKLRAKYALLQRSCQSEIHPHPPTHLLVVSSDADGETPIA